MHVYVDSIGNRNQEYFIIEHNWFTIFQNICKNDPNYDLILPQRNIINSFTQILANCKEQRCVEFHLDSDS